MNTYLFTWNPSKWHWSDLPEAIVKVNTDEVYDIYWSCGNTKKIQIGDAFFLMRLGVPQKKGIIGFGQVLSRPYSLPHWDEEKARAGKTALRVDLLFKALSDTALVDEKTLKTDIEIKQFNWFPQASGILIPPHIANHILGVIEEQTKSKYKPLSHEKLTNISEGKSKRITITSYDRSPIARQLCIDHYGTECVICGFDFEVTYGQIGKGFTHVHLSKLLMLAMNMKLTLSRICAQSVQIAMPCYIKSDQRMGLKI